jgi:DNA polymerase
MLYLDTETYSPVDINRGLDVYMGDPHFEVMLVAWAVDDSPVHVWDATAGPMPRELRDQLWTSTVKVVMHNSRFDRLALCYDDRIGVDITTDRVLDTMVLAALHGLPLRLGQLGEALGYDEDRAKLKDGRRLINLFCKPRPAGRKLARATRETHPDEWRRFIDYARRDVEVTRDALADIPRWNNCAREYQIWELDQTINERGIAVDLELAAAAVRAIGREQKELQETVLEVTRGAVSSATQRDKVLTYLREAGVEIADLKATTIDEMLKSGKVVGDLRRLLEARAAAGSTSAAKYQVVLDAQRDGRLRHLLQYGGAMRTLRWAGRLVQPQNFPRPSMKPAAVDQGIDALLIDAAHLIYNNVTDLVTSAVRGLFVAAKDKKLVVADYSAIEGRVLAWLAGEQWKLDAYAAGRDIYVESYAQTFATAPEAVTKAQRQVGKVMELALGYQGAVGAWATMSRGYGLSELVDRTTAEQAWAVRSVDDERTFADYFEAANTAAIVDVIRRWREANPAIVRLWSQLESAVRRVLHAQDDKPITVGKVQIDTITHHGWVWLRIRLPSRRYLSYPKAALALDQEPGKEDITYFGLNQLTRQWERLKSYGGKFAENITQAVARDLLAEGLINAEAAHYRVVLHVHDEILAEVPDTDRYTVEGLIGEMTKLPAWAEGLPLAAAGFETYRYRKE